MLLALLPFADVEAANVQWGVASLHYDVISGVNYPVVRVEAANLHHTSNFYIGIYTQGNSAVLASDPTDFHYLSSSPGGWIAAYVGDLVAESTMFNQREYFIDELAGSAKIGKQSVIAETGKPSYLKFAIQDSLEEDAYWEAVRNGQMPGKVPTTCYGWIEYIVDNTGAFFLVRSALDVDGDAIVVGEGSIPEPTEGCLLALGLAVFMLRRRRLAAS